MINGILGAWALALYLMMAFLLVRAYGRTRDRAYLWLFIPLVALPIAAIPLALWSQADVDRLSRGDVAHLAFPFSLASHGYLTTGATLTMLNLAEHVVWGVFALIAVIAIQSPKR